VAATESITASQTSTVLTSPIFFKQDRLIHWNGKK